MARLRRRWWILKWAGVVLSVSIAVAWGVSLRLCLVIGRTDSTPDAQGQYRTIQVAVGTGFVHPCTGLPFNSGEEHRTGWWALSFAARGGLIWLPRVKYWLWDDWIVVLPLWIPFLVAALPTGWLWWRDRRRIAPGHCEKCGYNLTGNISGICPECGEKVDAQAIPKV